MLMPSQFVGQIYSTQKFRIKKFT